MRWRRYAVGVILCKFDNFALMMMVLRVEYRHLLIESLSIESFRRRAVITQRRDIQV